jgi:hypothetical protein
MPDKPRYVDRPGDVVFRPPYLQARTLLTAWPLPSDAAALQKVLDVALNEPSGGAVEYRPLLPMVLLVLADIKQVSSLDPRDAGRGWVPEQDICFWILAGAYKKDAAGKSVLDHIAFYIPYIWVTNGYTMATGREAIGYPKSFGWAQMATSGSDPGPFWADGLVLPTFDPASEVTRNRLLTIGRDPGAVEGTSFGRGAGVAAARAFLEAIRGMHGWPAIDWNLVGELVADVMGKHLPMVFLKQFRDATDPTAACYQAIIEANATITDFQKGGLLPPGWTLQLQQYASAPFVGDLALPAGPTRLEVGFWVDYTFSMDLGREIWRAP